MNVKLQEAPIVPEPTGNFAVNSGDVVVGKISGKAYLVTAITIGDGRTSRGLLSLTTGIAYIESEGRLTANFVDFNTLDGKCYRPLKSGETVTISK